MIQASLVTFALPSYQTGQIVLALDWGTCQRDPGSTRRDSVQVGQARLSYQKGPRMVATALAAALMTSLGVKSKATLVW